FGPSPPIVSLLAKGARVSARFASRWSRLLHVEKTQLEQARGLEAIDPEHRPGCGSSRSRRHEPDELRAGDRCASCGRLLLDSLDDLLQRRRFPVLDVHAHLNEPCPRQVEAQRANAWKPASRLPNG